MSRDRDPSGRPRNARPRDEYGRPLPRGAAGVERVPDDYAPGGAETVTEAARLLGEGRPFHAHEVLEARWKNAPDDERAMWQGLAQICVGLTHLQRGNTRGAGTLLTRGADRVHGHSGGGGERTPYGMDLTGIVRRAHSLAADPAQADPSEAIAAVRALLDPGR
ncbi:DUF309 domain-containing protein [Spongiactinospora sp. TRM90649]|uniref:DUF309 domain-containing protein n=1 Tax=Spongiactinospora sp. TRM90649 TaxID=3031114 RepID=UPI0023F818BE|nr:DUF309 domain-containing protein [Spongiactinospora sp. TRM90649]MDF5754859.1 DUF309 domain-containing protein [Spongiactinospora sp. TRM90649]